MLLSKVQVKFTSEDLTDLSSFITYAHKVN